MKKSRRAKKALLLLATLVAVTGLGFAASHHSSASHWYAPSASSGSGGHWSTPHTA